MSDRRQVLTGDLLHALGLAAGGRPAVIQIREKDLAAGELYRLTVDILKIARPHGVKVLVNDRVDVALAAGADGAHLGGAGLPLLESRKILEGRLLGASVHSLEEALDAERVGVDYVTFGHIFSTTSKPGLEPRGLDALGCVTANLKVPVVAIGGINLRNLGEVKKAGARGIAVISAVIKAPHPGEAVREIVRCWEVC